MIDTEEFKAEEPNGDTDSLPDEDNSIKSMENNYSGEITVSRISTPFRKLTKSRKKSASPDFIVKSSTKNLEIKTARKTKE